MKSAGARPTVTRYPVDGARRVRFGRDYWQRANAEALTPTTKLALTVSAPAAFRAEDTFSWIGLRSNFYRSITYSPPGIDPLTGQADVPDENATSSAGWTIEEPSLEQPYGAEASGLPTAGDDLMLVQSRSQFVAGPGARFDPWNRIDKYETVGVLAVASPTFTNGTTNTVTGSLAAPTKETITLNFAGSSFASIRESAGYPAVTRARATISMNQETGSGPGYLSSIAPDSWSLTTNSARNVIAPECFPEELEGACDPASCDVGCANATDGLVDPGDLDYTFEAPRTYATGLRDTYAAGYTFSTTWETPKGFFATLSATAGVAKLKTGMTLDIALELGPIRNLRLGGMELPWSGASLKEGTRPTITFDPPAVGTPEYYMVDVVDLVPNIEHITNDFVSPRAGARVFSRATSVDIPDDVLQRGHYYYLRIHAMLDGRDFSEPFISKSDTYLSTGIFSAPFQYVRGEE